MASTGSEYQKRQDGSATIFTVTPGKVPKFTTMIGVGAFSVLLGLGTMSGVSGGIGFVMLLMGGFAAWYGWTRDIRPKEHRKPSTFRVTPAEIEANGTTFHKDNIHRLILRNGITDQELLQVSTTSAAAMAGMAYKARVGLIANALTVEAGGKSTVLAGGMDETTAYGLLADVGKVLNFNLKEFAA